MSDEAWMKKRLTELYDEHRRLDEIILDISRQPVVDGFSLQRLKKRKLGLRDQIHKLETQLLPDIIA